MGFPLSTTQLTLNNMGLGCTGPFRHRLFSVVNTWVPHHPRWVESCDAEPRIQRTTYRGTTVRYLWIFHLVEGRRPNPRVLQGSAVLLFRSRNRIWFPVTICPFYSCSVGCQWGRTCPFLPSGGPLLLPFPPWVHGRHIRGPRPCGGLHHLHVGVVCVLF